jgi:hypothetical protein
MSNEQRKPDQEQRPAEMRHNRVRRLVCNYGPITSAGGAFIAVGGMLTGNPEVIIAGASLLAGSSVAQVVERRLK